MNKLKQHDVKKSMVLLFSLLLGIYLTGSGFSSELRKENHTSIRKAEKNADTRKFTLKNASAKSIPLIIPNVMNPNLSPFSTSGVELQLGQEILFREKKKKYLLLKVDEQINNGDVIEVSALLKERKKALGL